MHALRKGLAIERLCELDEGIWTIEGNPVEFLTFPYTLRSTIVDVGNGTLFVCSPVQLAVAADLVRSIGQVGYIVSPNKLHHLFLGDWASAFPNAALYAPPGLRAKRPDITFRAELGDSAEPGWAKVLDQRIVRGSLFMEEVVFFHRSSRTLIFGDLIENHDPKTFAWPHRTLARANAMLAPNGTTPRNFRCTFWYREEARRTVREILSWEPRRVVVMHGPCVERNAMRFLERAFAWLV